MRKVEVTAPFFTVHSGRVGLSADQAKARLHNLKAVQGQVDDKPESKTYRAGVYEVVQSVQFKRGEEFGYSGEVMKNGQLRDPQAEAGDRTEDAERVRRTLRADYTRRLNDLVEQHAAQLEQAKGAFVNAILSRIEDANVKGAVLKAIDEMSKSAEPPAGAAEDGGKGGKGKQK